MPQGATLTLITLFLYLTGLFGGKSNPSLPSTPPSLSSPAAPVEQSAINPPGAGGSALTTTDLVNVRSGPGTSYPTLATLPRGTPLSVLSGRNGWLKVKIPDGRTGWVVSWLVGPASTATGPTRKPLEAREILGYYTGTSGSDSGSYTSLANNWRSLTAVAPFFFRIDGAGNVSGRHDPAVVNLARARGLKALALVHNHNQTSFDADAVHNMLSSASRRARAIAAIGNILRTYGYDGVNIDFENLYPWDRPYFTAFLRELAASLRPRGYLVTVAVPAKYRDDPSSRWAGAVDYRAIGQYADLVVIMTYDEHFRLGKPGPIASIQWVKNVVEYARTQIPPQKIILGLAAYGYDWPSGGGSGRALSYWQALNLARRVGASIKWDPVAKAPYFSYYRGKERRVVWFESSYSAEHKLALVNHYGLRGVALWKLGYEDPRLWSLLQTLL